MKIRIGILVLGLTTTIYGNSINGFGKYMHGYASTKNNKEKATDVFGFELGYKYKIDEKFDTKFTIMGVQPIGNDNTCIRIIGSKYTRDKGYNVLAERFIRYDDGKNKIILGRQKLNSPLLASNVTKMSYETLVLSGTFEALKYQRKINNGYFDFNVITKYKQRTSDKFYKLGTNITGNFTSLDMDYLALVGYTKKIQKIKFQIWDLEAMNLTNTLYADASYTKKFNGMKLNFATQFLIQNIHSSSKKISSPINTVDNSNLMGGKVTLSKDESKLLLAVTKSGKNQIILPWDGSPAFSRICVTNALTRSIKGIGLKKYDGAYMADTLGYKIAYIQKFGKFGLPNLKSVLAYATYSPDKINTKQKNKMLYLTYKMDGIMKGLTLSTAYTKVDNFDSTKWVVKENKDYTHYKLIINYRF